MLINWFTVIAQIINFLILVGLLKHFLYKPIFKAIDEREKKITARIEDARKKEADAIEERKELLAKNTAFDRQKNELMNKVIEEAKAERQHLLDEAKEEALTIRKRLEKSLQEDLQNLNSEISRRTKTEVFAIARKTLKELADSSLDDRIAKVFSNRLKNASEEEKKKLISSFKSSSEPIIVQSVFKLSESQEKEIEATLKEILGTSVRLKFETSPELVSGIELNADGYKIAWSISEYLTSMERNIDELMSSKIMNAG